MGMKVRRWLTVFAVVGCLLAAAYVSRTQLLTCAALPLVSTDNGHLRKADAVMVLGGGSDTRSFEAARVFRDELAPVLLLANQEPGRAAELGLDRSGTEITLDVLTKIVGIPPDKIVLIGTRGEARWSDQAGQGKLLEEWRALGFVTSTFEEAKTLQRWCEAHGAGSVIVVTNTLYSRRVRRIFRKVLGDTIHLQVATTDSLKFNDEDWWRTEEGLIAVNNEWVKTVYYWVKY